MFVRRMLSAVVMLCAVAFSAHASDPFNAEVYVVHGIPGKDLNLPDALPVDVAVDGACVLESFEFGDIAGALTLAPGTYNIAISLANPNDPCSEPPVIEGDFSFAQGECATIVAHLFGDGTFGATKFQNDLSKMPSAGSRVVFHHAANAPAVDVKAIRSIAPFQPVLIADFLNGQQAGALLRSGDWKAGLTAANTSSPVLGPLDLSLAGETVYFVYAVGSLANDTLTVIVNAVSSN